MEDGVVKVQLDDAINNRELTVYLDQSEEGENISSLIETELRLLEKRQASVQMKVLYKGET